MSKIYISSNFQEKVGLLEISAPQNFKEVYIRIKKSVPRANIGIYGARDFQTLKRSNRNLRNCNVFKSVDAFITEIRK